MTTINTNNPLDGQPADRARSLAADDPARVDLGATQPIDVTALLADREPRYSTAPSPRVVDSEQLAAADHDDEAS